MKISKLRIRNFRGLEDVRLDIGKSFNVIVGPNAVGKSTILESIRLYKALLFPRYLNEAGQVLQSLGVVPQHPELRSYFNFGGIAGDEKKPINIEMHFRFSDEELLRIRDNIGPLSINVLRATMGNSADQGNAALTQFLSSSQGRKRLEEISEKVKTETGALTKDTDIHLGLEILPDGRMAGQNQIVQAAVASLEQGLPPKFALFSYFPADRALPSGETGVSIGSGEAHAQVQSHIGQPSTKYSRLKQTIVNESLFHRSRVTKIEEEFRTCFENLLPGKQLVGLEVSNIGTLKVIIKDLETGKVFDIDNMSSGEKGLILTFLIIRQTMSKGGILLIDEPELHLNPSVCRRLVPFFLEKVVNEMGLQALVCTHSAEILGDAFETPDCGIFHLRSGTDATIIYPEDNDEFFEAMRRLGNSPAQSLFTKGTIYLEGESDVEILDSGFGSKLTGYDLKYLGGRTNVEREIKVLVDKEKKQSLGKPHVFVFDRDKFPSGSTGFGMVKVHQWDRYCIENYLLDEKCLFDIFKENGELGATSRGEFTKKLEEVAMNQIPLVVAMVIYSKIEPDNPGIRPKEIDGKKYVDIAESIFSRLGRIHDQVSALFSSDAQKKEFVEKCMAKDLEIRELWKADWPKLCNGKKVFDDLYATYKMNISKTEAKKKVMKKMVQEKADGWRLIDSTITELLKI